MYDFRFRYAGLDVSTPQAAADAIRSRLAPLFTGNFFKVVGGRGVGVEFARMEPESFAKRQWTHGFSGPSNMRCLVVIAPSTLGSGAWQDLNVKFGGSPDEVKELKAAGISLRRASGLAPEKAVDAVIKWFIQHAAKLKG